MLKAEDVIRRLAAIAFADASDLVTVEVLPCRHCYGIGHAYQWRTREEFAAAHRAWLTLPRKRKADQLEPGDAGGFGYTGHAAPHPNCPECDGEGHTRLIFKDVSRAPAGARALFAGAKRNSSGFTEIKMHDKLAALTKLGEHLGIFRADNQKEGAATGIGGQMAEILLGIATKVSSRPIIDRGATQCEQGSAERWVATRRTGLN